MKATMYNFNKTLVFPFEANNATEAMNIARQTFERCGFINRMYVEFNGEIIGQVTC